MKPCFERIVSDHNLVPPHYASSGSPIILFLQVYIIFAPSELVNVAQSLRVNKHSTTKQRAPELIRTTSGPCSGLTDEEPRAKLTGNQLDLLQPPHVIYVPFNFNKPVFIEKMHMIYSLITSWQYVAKEDKSN
jgi:hypothetical protein